MPIAGILLACNADVKILRAYTSPRDWKDDTMQRKRKRKPRPLTKSEQMARVRGVDTGPEMALRRALWRVGLRYRVRPRIPGRPDLAFVGSKIAVFVDGCFWHGCPDHYKASATNVAFWSEKISRNRQRDREVEIALAKRGWTVLRYWEHEVEGGLALVVDRIQAAVVRARKDSVCQTRDAAAQPKSE